MMRIVLILLAVLIAVLSFVLDQPWLYWAAGALLIVALGALASHLWQMYSESKQFQRKGDASKDREDELRELGIMDVRPQQEGESGQHEAQTSEQSPQQSEKLPATESTSPQSATAPANDSTNESVNDPVNTTDPSEQADEDSAVGPYLEALRRALGAQTACLLVQDEMALEYRIEAIRSSRSGAVQSAGAVFETDEPLLTAGMSRQEVTVRAIGDDVPRSALGYYTGTVPVTQMAVAPVPRSESSTYFLLIDATEAVHLDARRARNLMTRFAEGMHLLIEAEASPPEPAPTETEALEPEQAADPSGPAGDGASPRPRSEIIAEEMQRVQQADRQLALALVHLNRAERIAQDGSEAVAAAEDELRTRLQQLDPESRVERFGELTFGVFYTGDAADVEPWAELLQEEMAQATGTLEGGVSIGVALWRDQDPETLREDATEALRVAYETGDCTIVE